jgi:N-acetylglucosaminyl-diphospho-decaprenol L-rhamnosyltransferase
MSSAKFPRVASCAVVIVTHNSHEYLEKCIDCLRQQTLRPAQIIIVDSGSSDTSYVQRYHNNRGITVVLSGDNIGFCQGNNLGYKQVDPLCEYVLLLNPDAFLTDRFLKEALVYLKKRPNHDVAVVTGMLLGYDRQTDQPTGEYDSTGIFRTWFGRWYDRGQGDRYPHVLYQKEESIPAVCGALMLCRKKALDEVLLDDEAIFDPAFYMYKEDIDLSLRLRRKGWSLKYVPSLVAYHCRGWRKNRRGVPKVFRLMSARNEMRIYARNGSPCVIYSALKYAAVKLLNY